MDLKPHEIILAVLAVAIPAIVLVLAFTPGGLNFVFEIAVHPVWGPVAFFGGAAVLFGVLAWRIFRRIRPAPKKAAPKPTPHLSRKWRAPQPWSASRTGSRRPDSQGQA